jgi:hypothetical protein
MYPLLRPLFNSMRSAVLRQDVGGPEDGFVRHRKPRKEPVMKCSHPMCNRGIGLVSHRRWFHKGLDCSRGCRDDYAIMQTRPKRAQLADAKRFAWLLAPLDAHAHRPLVRATVPLQRRQMSV